MKKLVAVTCVLAMSSYAAQDTGKTLVPDPTDPAVAIAQAKAAANKTEAVGFLWRDTEQLIKDATEAAARGDTATALKLATQALHQAENGYKQYERSQQMPPLL
jgi:hypothetical protein